MSAQPGMPRALLEVTGLRTYFHAREGVHRAVDGVDLSIPAGRTLCLVGESGSGKSLTGLSIMRLVDPPGRVMPGSRILFEGRDLAVSSEKEMRKIRGSQLAMIFQEPLSSLNPLFTVGNQLGEAIQAHERMSHRERRDRCVELLRLVGIPSPERRLHDYPHQLSGGMRQRVMIAIAISCNPRLLIADEPTTALDVTIQAQILELLRELQERLHMAVLLITHDFGVVAQVADDVAVMYAGLIVERGPAREVLKTPKHPYTMALLASIPSLGKSKDQPLAVIPGSVPSSRSWPPACRFAPRCAYVFERCVQEAPPLFSVDRQLAACWLREDEAAAPVSRRPEVAG